MGKLIISETEKKNILSLYEATNVAPPPSESILVANKNPFKYPEYLNARKFYNPSLKNGELFFNLTYGFNDYILDELKIKMKDKTFRGIINTFGHSFFFEKNSDVIIQIKDLQVYTKVNPPPGSNKKTEVAGSQCVETIYFDALVNDKPQTNLSYDINPGTEISFGWWEYGDSKSGEIKLVNAQSLKSVIFSVSNWNLIPDEYFEIRKIQRQQTDF